MALIQCPECGKEISDKAVACPHCGLPLTKEVASVQPEEITPVDDGLEHLVCPDFPADLSIGQQITNWKFDAAFKGIFDQSINTIPLTSGEVQVILHTHGIRLWVGLQTYEIHHSQIINIQKTTSAQLAQMNKSVIGRAVVGDLIMGPLGAIIGGMSALGAKQGVVVTQYVVINFWDVNTRTPQTLLITCNGDQTVDAFINRQKEESQKNISEDRAPEAEHMPIWAIICILVIIGSVIAIIAS